MAITQDANSGSSTVNAGPATYAKLFPEALADKCSPDALESNNGPVAYLHALYEQAKALEATRTSDPLFTLAHRRPDIAELVLSEESLAKQIPPLTLVIKALSRQAQLHAGADNSLNQALSEARLTQGLPFHLPLEEIQTVLDYKKLPLFELLQTSEYTFPGFCFGQLRSEELRDVMRAATGFSPALQSLLLESDAKASESLLQRFGATGSNALNDLRSVEYFCRKTGLKSDDVFDLLATSGVADEATESVTAVKMSAKYKPETATGLDGCLYGAMFINNGKAPALSLEDKLAGPGITLAIKNATTAHFVRIHKIIHLRHALKLSFAQTDLLLMSAIQAEGQTKDFQITEDTLRALGVFRYLNEAYGISAEQFAALIYQVSPYALGDDVPFLDRVLDGPGAGELADIDERLIIDGRAFDPAELADNTGHSSAHSTIGQLCKAMGMDERLTNVHLAQATKALGLKKPTLSISMISSLYRLSRLPRLLHLSVNAGLSLLGVLASNNPDILNSLAGKPSISSEGNSADVLDVLIALVNMEAWMRRNKISPPTVLTWITPVTPVSSVSTTVKQAVSDQESRLEGSLLTEPKIKLAVGTNTLAASAGNWTAILSPYLDESGLIKPEQTRTAEVVDEIKRLLAGKLVNQTLAHDVATALERLIKNNLALQEEVLSQIVKSAISTGELTRKLSTAHALPLVRWTGQTRFAVLANIRSALRSDTEANPTPTTSLDGLDAQAWEKVIRYGQALTGLRISPLGLTALLDHPEWFDLTDSEPVPTIGHTTTEQVPVALSVDTCYQLSRYRDWVEQCQKNGFSEQDALQYLTDFANQDTPDSATEAAQQLAKLIGWQSSETVAAVPCIEQVIRSKVEATHPKTYDDFLNSLTAGERQFHDVPGRGIFRVIKNYLYLPPGNKNRYSNPFHQSIHKKFTQFIEDNKLPLKVTSAQFAAGNKPKEWACYGEKITTPMELEIYIPPTPSEVETIELTPCVPNIITDIDFILRIQSLSLTTGLSCQSLLDFSTLDQDSSYADYETAGRLMLGACSESEVGKIQPTLQEKYREALTAYLLAYWAAANPELASRLTTTEDLSSYFLIDVEVGQEAKKTTAVSNAIVSLQHYLHRLFSHLEPGYDTAERPEALAHAWQQYLSQYGSWKQWQSQRNHPENLIYYANRPQKSKAFQDLEVEVNQGKLDSELLQTAVCNYLTKFERISNLQIVSGYLDGHDPKNDTYYLIGKTNTSPIEYYLRSVDMGLRDDQERLSALAWSEWEKITLPISGQIVQSSYRDPDTSQVYYCDAVRPVIIAGRPYVFWVERGTTGLPSSDEKNQTPTKFKKLSVQYVYLQSDGFWSTANELICLDGTKDGKRLPDANNNYLKDDSFTPGLIVFVNTQGERNSDPWLTTVLYNCDYDAKSPRSAVAPGTQNEDYFVEMRDLLLTEKRNLPQERVDNLLMTVYRSYRDLRKVQHPYDGLPPTIPPLSVKSEETSYYADLLKSEREELNIDTSEICRNEFSIALSLNEETNIMEIKLKFEEYLRIYLSISSEGNHVFTAAIDKYTDFIHRSYADDMLAKTEHFTPPSNDSLKIEANIYLQQEEKTLTYTFTNFRTDEVWDIIIFKNVEHADMLDLAATSKEVSPLASNKIRLNTLFGKQLVARATQSIERALEWDTQKLLEPTIDSANPNPPVDFHGANGLYFRELFLHLPALIATRLTEQQQFEEAEAWYLRYLFDPYRSTPSRDGRPPYWNTRPLAEVGTLGSKLNKSVDPTARAFILSRYYQQAVFLSLVENWQRQGDHYYRQLSLSSLSHAWLCYQQALKLIGPLPERASVSRWQATTLSAVSSGDFRAPINQRVTETKALLERRLFNLRHGLTLDGKKLPDLSWGDEGTAPFASAEGGLSILATAYNSDRASIPAYRFRQLLPIARAAVQQLLDLGRHYMKLMEDEFNTTFSVLLKAQEIKISDFTLRLNKEAINSVKEQRGVLELSRAAAISRLQYFSDLLDTGRNTKEEAATGLLWTAGYMNFMTAPLSIAEGSAKAVPRIFGLAIGGSDISGPVTAAKDIIRGTASFLNFISQQLLIEASYDRRAQEWAFEKQQAEFDVLKIDKELAELTVEMNAATISLDHARQERSNLEEAYVAMTTGFTIIPIYNWLVARQELLYGAAYDAVLSLCLGLEAAWRYEIGDYSREAFIKTSAWSDSYKGMLAGESLWVDLQEMENAYMLANERRLNIKKTFSLSTMLGEKVFQDALQSLTQSKPFAFGFKARDFDKQYPGHYLRQLKHVSVSFVLNANASLDELSAILTQTANTTLVEPTKEGADYLYKSAKTIPRSIKRNLRAQQQIALSSLTSEDGLGYSPGEWLYELMFHDGRYLPFEGTGAISEWQLAIPSVEVAQSLKSCVKDIQVNLLYSALPADPEFTTMINELRKA